LVLAFCQCRTLPTNDAKVPRYFPRFPRRQRASHPVLGCKGVLTMGTVPRSVVNAVKVWLLHGKHQTGLSALSPTTRLKAMLMNDRLHRMLRRARRGQ